MFRFRKKPPCFSSIRVKKRNGISVAFLFVCTEIQRDIVGVPTTLFLSVLYTFFISIKFDKALRPVCHFD